MPDGRDPFGVGIGIGIGVERTDTDFRREARDVCSWDVRRRWPSWGPEARKVRIHPDPDTDRDPDEHRSSTEPTTPCSCRAKLGTLG